MASTAVVTGAAGGLGAGFARALVARGWNVAIADRDEALLQQQLERLAAAGARERLLAAPCDVTAPATVQGLWDRAVARFGRVDLWINNAGLGGTQKLVADSALEDLLPIVDVNLKGVIAGTHVALRGMRAQGGGRIYNVAGFGVDGMIRKTMATYGATKRAVGYFTQAVAREEAGGAVSLGWINPGMVVTPMVLGGARKLGADEWRKGGRIVFNLFGETPDDAAEMAVRKILADRRNGTFIRILTPGRMLYCLARKALGPRRDLFAAHGL